jgi:ADP-heptose:LPS heptosyltransferase
VIFVTNTAFTELVRLSDGPDAFFGSKIWCWPFRFPQNFQFLGLVQEVYCPVNPDEIDPRSGVKGHLIESLGESCGVVLKNLQPELRVSPSTVSAHRDKYAPEKGRAESRLLIAINGGPTWPVRMWQTQKWQQLIEKIHQSFEAEILLLGQMQAGRGSDLMELRGVTCLFDGIRPEQIAALLKACDLLIAIDSGPIHIAGAVGTPVVGLFGAVDPEFRMPPDSPGKAVVGDVPCLYCNHRIPIGHWKENCLNGIACMEAITVDQVFSAVVEILEKNPKTEICRKHRSGI